MLFGEIKIFLSLKRSRKKSAYQAHTSQAMRHALLYAAMIPMHRDATQYPDFLRMRPFGTNNVNILLIQPPLRDSYRTQLRTQPLGLACLAAAVREHGHTVSILDCLTRAQRSCPVPEKLQYMHKHYVSGDQTPFRLYSRFYAFGMNAHEIRARIAAARPDAVGLQCQFTRTQRMPFRLPRLSKP